MATPMSPQATESSDLEPYTMHVSSRYLDLTKKKLELTRMPREIRLLSEDVWTLGTPKTALEPLIDYWLESYDWRAQEAFFNSSLRQYRVTIQNPAPWTVSSPDLSNIDIEAAAATPEPEPDPLRIHFLHHRSESATAIPLLYCHTWPGSFLEISRVIDALVSPVEETPTQQQSAQAWRAKIAFHVVAPSLPGFGFSDASSREGFGAKGSADVLVSLMAKLGYERFVVWGDGWGFKVARMLALHHPKHIAAVYTSHAPDLPAPQVLRHKDAWLKYQIARLTGAKLPWLSFGYTSSDFGIAEMKTTDANDDREKPEMRKKLRKTRSREEDIELGSRPAESAVDINKHVDADEELGKNESAAKEAIPGRNRPESDVVRWREFPSGLVASRPQTLSYALCDSPAGLLAIILDALKPTISHTAPAQSQSELESRRRSANMLQHKPPTMTISIQTSFTPADILNWTMMYWLPGPEASLRWILATEREDCYAEYSEVPLGVSWYARPGLGPTTSAPQPSQTARSSSRSPSIGKASVNTSPTTLAETASASPMWASAVQNLKWVKRRSEVIESGIPAWEKSAAVLEDVREYCKMGQNEGWLGL